MRDAVHVAYVNPADPGMRTPEQCAAEWWSSHETMAAVVRRGLRVTVLVRTRLGPVGFERDGFERDGVRYLGVPDDRPGLRTALTVRRLRPDLVHANGFVFPLRTLVLGATNVRTPLVVQHHGGPPSFVARVAHLQRLVGRRADAALFTGSRWGAADPWLAAGVLHPSKVRDVIETVVPPTTIDRVGARARTGVTGDPAVLWVGRLEPGKDPFTALAALERAALDRPGLTGWFVTPGGSLAPSFRAAVDTSPVSTRLRVVGPVAREEMVQWYSAADVLLSTSHAEGSGYAVIEAVAAGLRRFVVSDLPSHRSILGAEGVCGPRPGDVDAFSHALGRVMDRPIPDRPAEDAAGQLIDVYRSVIAGHRRPGCLNPVVPSIG